MNKKQFFFGGGILAVTLVHLQLKAQIMADAGPALRMHFSHPDEKEKKKVTVISIDSSQLPPGVVVQRTEKPPELPEIDSSRFIKRTERNVKDQRDLIAYKDLRMNKSVFGKDADYIVGYVRSYHQNYGSKMNRMMHNNRRHFSFIENVFKSYGIPKELKSLAVIESAMNFTATSSVGARGPWQFMPETARLLGLRVDERVDERTDFYKSTRAAAQYLRRINQMYRGDWLLTVAGYNWGPGNITRCLNKVKGNSFWDIKHMLPRETRNHVMAFIATTAFMEPNADVLAMGRYPYGAKAPQPNFDALHSAFQNDDASYESNVFRFEKDEPKIAPSEKDKIAVLKVKGTYLLSVIAGQLKTDLGTLQRWNPNFDNHAVQKDTEPFYLRIPIDKLEAFILVKESISIESRKVLGG